SKAHCMEQAKADWQAKQDGKNYDYNVQLAAGTHPHVQPRNHAWHPSYSAEWIANYQKDEAEQNAKRIAEAKALTSVSRDQYIANLLAKRIAAVEAADYVKFTNLGWCGRRDLADKLAAKSSGG